jgi:hypothetical protein
VHIRTTTTAHFVWAISFGMHHRKGRRTYEIPLAAVSYVPFHWEAH